MKIIENRSEISELEEQLLKSGYADLDVKCFRFTFRASETDSSHLPTVGNAYGISDRSEYMHAVIEEIAHVFICYQYRFTMMRPTQPVDEHGNELRHHMDQRWHFSFTCGSSMRMVDGVFKAANDYSCFTLTSNPSKRPWERVTDHSYLIEFLREHFSALNNLHVEIWYKAHLAKIPFSLVNEAREELVGLKCSYNGMEGKLIQPEVGMLYFLKNGEDNKILLEQWETVALAFQHHLLSAPNTGGNSMQEEQNEQEKYC